MRQGPLAGRYPAAAAMVIFALVPYLGLSAALQPLTPIIGQQLHMSAADDEPGLRLGERGLRGRNRPRCAVRPAASAATDDGPVRGVARDRVGGIGGRAEFRDVHRRPHPARPLHKPAVDRGRSATGDRLRAAQDPLDRGDHERLHLRCRGARPDDRRHPGQRTRLAAAVLDHCRALAGGAGPVAADIRGLPTRRPGGAAGRGRAQPRHVGLRVGVLWRLGAAHAPLPGRPDGRTAGGWARADRRAGRQPVPRQASAADDPHDADQHGARRGDRGRARGGCRLGDRDRPDRGRARAALRAAAPWAPVPARAGRRADHRGGARHRDQQTPAALSAARRNGVPGGRNRRVPDPGAADAGAHPDRLGPDRGRARGGGRPGAVRRRLLAARGKPAAGVRDRRAAARGRRVHGRSGVRARRPHRRREPDGRDRDRALDRPRDRHRWRAGRGRPLRARRCPRPQRRTSPASWTATVRPGTRHRCWPPSAAASRHPALADEPARS